MKIKIFVAVISFCFLNPNARAAWAEVNGLVYLQDSELSFACSGSLFAPKNYDKSQKALVLTNGHCANVGSSTMMGAITPSTTEQINNYFPGKAVDFGILKNGAEDLYNDLYWINTKHDVQLMVATMYKKDIAIFQISQTYEELEQLGFLPLILASTAPKISTNVTYHSSTWGSQVTCSLEAYVDTLVEGMWTWNNVMRMSGTSCTAEGGASGSPVLDENGNLVATLNTMDENGLHCSVNNPCERDRASGNSIVYDWRLYAIPVVSLNKCFDQNKKFDLSLCDLQ